MTIDDIKSWFDGKFSPERQAEMEQWFIEHFDSPVLDKALEEILQRCSKAERERTLRAFGDACHRLGLTPPRRRSLGSAVTATATAAAALAAGVVLGISFDIGSDNSHTATEWVEVYAHAGENRTVVLPDSSVLRLSPASLLIYDAAGYASCRNVYVYGGAYAEVTSDPTHPFSIHSDNTTVTVLGTRFDICNYADDSEMEVMLYEGAVKVESTFAGRSDSISLIPGEAVKYDKRTGSRSIIDIHGLDGHASSEFLFIDRQLSDIVNELERHFGINIVIENAELGQKKFYAIFANNESLDEILDGLNWAGAMDIRRFDKHTIAIR